MVEAWDVLPMRRVRHTETRDLGSDVTITMDVWVLGIVTDAAGLVLGSHVSGIWEGDRVVSIEGLSLSQWRGSATNDELTVELTRDDQMLRVRVAPKQMASTAWGLLDGE